jgi:hypothetical protein
LLLTDPQATNAAPSPKLASLFIVPILRLGGHKFVG